MHVIPLIVFARVIVKDPSPKEISSSHDADPPPKIEMIRDGQHEIAAWLENPPDLGHEAIRRLQVFEDVLGYDYAHGMVVERELKAREIEVDGVELKPEGFSSFARGFAVVKE